MMDLALFAHPSAEHLGAPFWVWNCKLERDTLLRQMEIFREMGMGGVTIHCRTGLATEYMGPEFMEIVGECAKKARQMGMKLYLYDEDRWPSGFAGGKVTKDPALRAQYINFLPEKLAGEWDGPLLARYEIDLRDGYLHSYRRLSDGETGNNVWHAHRKTRATGPRFNGQSYVDTLNPQAIHRFIELTHEAYFEAVGEEFGDTIPSIFSDEPQIMNKTVLEHPEDVHEVHMPFTADFPETYYRQYGADVLDTLPEVVWELPDGKVSEARYRYHCHALERFAQAFPDQIGSWCEKHGIAMTGHLMGEQNLRVLTVESGEPMRLYRGFTIPGIDMLCDAREYSTAKQCQSVVHQMGRQGMTSEVYGVTNWDFDFRGHKLQGDWQAALGVTHRVHHLAWASMAGESKRDYPASIFYQSPWYERYRFIEEHFGRLNTVLKRGKPVVKVGVIHPLESYWLAFGPEQQTADTREELENQFAQTVEWLLFGQIDFDFIGEALTETLETDLCDGKLRIGQMEYSAVVVPGCRTLRKNTLRLLERFAEAGGTIIFMGDIPRYVEAVSSEEPARLAKRCEQIPFDKLKLLKTLEPCRTVKITNENGTMCSEYLYQLRRDGDDLFLFVAFGRRVDDPDAQNIQRNCQYNPDVPIPRRITISLPGQYQAYILDTLNGQQYAVDSCYDGVDTHVSRTVFVHDSILLRFCTRHVDAEREKAAPVLTCVRSLNDVTEYQREEPNALILDQAEFRWNGGQWSCCEELLRIDTKIKRLCGFPVDAGDIVQPWAQPAPVVKGYVDLRFRFDSLCSQESVKLACEYGTCAKYRLNGKEFVPDFQGFYVDPCLMTCPLGPIHQGQNILEISVPYTGRTSLEWCYLLGDFGVNLCGNRGILVSQPEKIGFGDLSRQLHPFYGGNLLYHCEVDFDEGEYVLEVDKFRCPVIVCFVDEKEVGTISIAPYRVHLGKLNGKHRITLKAYGNRVNTFGCIHNSDDTTCWFSPDAWRTQGARFSYEYQLKRTGILSAPMLYRVVDDTVEN